MTVEVVTIHPSIIIVKSDARTYELPTSCFPQPPRVGQRWTLRLDHEQSEDEQRETLNTLLPRA